MSEDEREFKPDWYSPTGVTVRECMELRGISKEQLSCMLGETNNDYVDALLDGEAPVGRSSAVTLATALGATPYLWLSLDNHYWTERRRIESSRKEKS